MADNVVALDGVDDMLVIGPADKFETELIIWSSSLDSFFTSTEATDNEWLFLPRVAVESSSVTKLDPLDDKDVVDGVNDKLCDILKFWDLSRWLFTLAAITQKITCFLDMLLLRDVESY